MRKICVACKEDKLLSEFPFKNTEEGTKSSRCFICQRLYSKSHYQLNKKEYAENNAKHRRKRMLANRKIVLEHFKKNPCVDCGETDPIVLQFDHVRGEKSFSIGNKYRDIEPENLLKEIEKCETRCANCHARRTAKQQKWFRLIENDLE